MEIFELKTFIETAEEKVTELRKYLDIDALESQIAALESQTYEPAFWDDHVAANKVIMQLKVYKQKVASYEDILERLENLQIMLELLEMEETVETLEKDVRAFTEKLDAFEVQLYLSEDYDPLGAVIEIHPGAGGTESQDWAMMLYRMLKRYCEEKGHHFELNDYQEGTEAGIKSVTFTVSGSYAFGYLKAEAGVHRLVRISPFDASGRRHTSFASVNVIPDIDDSINIDLNENDLKIDTYRSSGAGGQSVNTTDSAVRITHLPTKLTVTCQNERSQIKNRDKALKILKGKLYQLELEKQHETLTSMRNTGTSNAFGSQIRSYVLHPYAMVKDHRTQVETGNVQKVLDGDLDAFIAAYLKHAAKESDDGHVA